MIARSYTARYSFLMAFAVLIKLYLAKSISSADRSLIAISLREAFITK